MTEEAIRSFAMTLPYVVDFNDAADLGRNPSCNSICGFGCGGGRGGTKQR